ncbi:hypothetical protein LX32DRAFT_294222 [Colletotrichum zoysiae]|uniref:Uncharacterized protein n=1 Tax=Colletotrichum zoysiae TaxID=1216348 RepID=A0AAD9M306_9PEZI|nr:hypothetical protein LX32DRAFT_294222 [Colletotrichum zoysiae]
MNPGHRPQRSRNNICSSLQRQSLGSKIIILTFRKNVLSSVSISQCSAPVPAASKRRYQGSKWVSAEAGLEWRFILSLRGPPSRWWRRRGGGVSCYHLPRPWRLSWLRFSFSLLLLCTPMTLRATLHKLPKFSRPWLPSLPISRLSIYKGSLVSPQTSAIPKSRLPNPNTTSSPPNRRRRRRRRRNRSFFLVLEANLCSDLTWRIYFLTLVELV